MKRYVKIQIAGIRNLSDAQMCVDAGVDIIGLLIGQKHVSDDFLTIEEANNIVKGLNKDVETTLITHLESAVEIINILKKVKVKNIQLHSYIDESEVEKIVKCFPTIKLFRLIHILKDGTTRPDISKFKYVDFYFTDSINQETNQFGGTGLVHNFDIDKRLIAKLNKPVFVAGGLNYKNVRQVIEQTKCYGVDVNSGCRAINGSRDKDLTIKFVQSVRK